MELLTSSGKLPNIVIFLHLLLKSFTGGQEIDKVCLHKNPTFIIYKQWIYKGP